MAAWTPAEKLTRADDLMSDILDCFLWPHANKRTIKFTPDYRTPRTLPVNELRQIIHQLQTAQLRNITEATTRIRQLPAVIAYLNNAEPPRLGKHIGLYLQLFLPKCGIRFCETDRYDQRRQAPPSPAAQAARQRSRIRPNELRDLLAQRRASTEPYNKLTHLAVFAARDYAPNDIIAGCEGSFADLTEQEDLNTDFSHIVNSRGKFQVFCGPARFVNHDCDNNAVLLREGFTIKFKVTKHIKAGQEILTSYGTNYFGEKNCECMSTSDQPQPLSVIKNEFDQPVPSSLATDTDLSSLLDSSEDRTSRASNTPAPETSPTVSYSTTPSQGPQKHRGLPFQQPSQPAAPRPSNSRSSSTRRQRTSLPEHADPLTQARTAAFPAAPIAELPIIQPAGFSAPVLPVKRKTYWITTKQKQLGLVPWEHAALDRPSPSALQPHTPLTPSLLGPSRTERAVVGSQKRKPATEPRPATRLPRRSYWVSTKEKQLGILPWQEEPDDTDHPAPAHPPQPSRATRASRRASEGMDNVVGFPTAPRGSKLSYKIFDTDSHEYQLLNTAIGRELLGFRPRPQKKPKLVPQPAAAADDDPASPEPVVGSQTDGLASLEADAMAAPFAEIASFLRTYPGEQPSGQESNPQEERAGDEEGDDDRRPPETGPALPAGPPPSVPPKQPSTRRARRRHKPKPAPSSRPSSRASRKTPRPSSSSSSVAAVAVAGDPGEVPALPAASALSPPPPSAANPTQPVASPPLLLRPPAFSPGPAAPASPPPASEPPLPTSHRLFVSSVR
ncbi:hypothetical protein PtA15_18A68 [Puccinia triticina]|uniref:SET domain-containing protein n=1 Tax=Puccinia triticina TaxID=208348 RepID=A0ABY7DDE7_9BASI|nr:uncharacterized protein PtA15_18A68 [Puccinia triticina]WAQ93012.1 hypothetical protein PtA15_18A68 [Puccinia triticina]WAR62995.1 hypothetical protein PtB15_18B77 [Puccinia triticina]